MADPISIVGFAASIIAFIDFSSKLIRGSYEVYKSTTGLTDDQAHVGTVVDDLQSVTKDLQTNLQDDGKHVQPLQKLARDCHKLSLELSEILESLKVDVDGSNKAWRSLESKWRSMRKEKEIASIEQKLISYRMELLLRLSLLLADQEASVRSKLDEIQSGGILLGKNDQTKLADIHKSVEKLTGFVMKEAQASSPSIEKEQSEKLSQINSALAALAFKLNDMPKLNSVENLILGKLCFPTMYAREDNVHRAADGTFRWLLEDVAEDTTSVSMSESIVSWELEHEQGDPGAGGLEDDNDHMEGSSVDGSHAGESDAEDSVSNNLDTWSSQGLHRYFPWLPDAIPELQAVSRVEGDQDSIDDDIEDDPFESGVDVLHLRDAEDEESINTSGSDWPISDQEEQRRTRDAFVHWLTCQNGVYHISGKAGSGKSTLFKFLINHPRLQELLQEWAGSKKLAFASFFFWQAGDQGHKSLEGLYKSLLFEVLRKCPHLIRDAFPAFFNQSGALRSEQELRPLKFSELEAAMAAISEQADSSNHRFCFFIDGLDEYDADSTAHEELAKTLKKWAASPDVKICVSSRPHVEFLDGFSDSSRLHLHLLTRPDIHRYVRTALSTADKIHLVPGWDCLVEQIVESSSGVFLWVGLVVRAVLDGIRWRDSLPTLQRRIEQTPRDLDALFDKILGAIDPAYQCLSARYFLLATLAPRKPVNALMYSWLEDLDDADFPFKSPCQPYSNADINDRLEIVHYRLASITKGLLEMHDYDHYDARDSPELSTVEDRLFTNVVDVFHKSVLEYLEQPGRLAQMTRDAGEFDLPSAYRRLLLAEFKFANLTETFAGPYVRRPGTLRTFFDNFTGSGVDDMSFKVALEYERILGNRGMDITIDGYFRKRRPMSATRKKPSEDTLSKKLDIDGRHVYDTDINGAADDEDEDEDGHTHYIPPLSYGLFVHYMAVAGCDEFVLRHVQSNPDALKPEHRRSLLLTTLVYGRHMLFRKLVRQGASPNDRIPVGFRSGASLSAVPTWLAFLVLVDLFRDHRRNVYGRNCFEALEAVLDAGAGGDGPITVRFLFRPDDDTPFSVSLENSIMALNPPNAHSLLQKILMRQHKGRSWYAGFLEAARRTGLSNRPEQEEYPPLDIETFRNRWLPTVRAGSISWWAVCAAGETGWVSSDLVFVVPTYRIE